MANSAKGFLNIYEVMVASATTTYGTHLRTASHPGLTFSKLRPPVKAMPPIAITETRLIFLLM